MINKLYKLYSRTNTENIELHKQLSKKTKKEPKSLSGDDLINIDELKIINNWSEDYYKTIKNIYQKL